VGGVISTERLALVPNGGLRVGGLGLQRARGQLAPSSSGFAAEDMISHARCGAVLAEANKRPLPKNLGKSARCWRVQRKKLKEITSRIEEIRRELERPWKEAKSGVFESVAPLITKPAHLAHSRRGRKWAGSPLTRPAGILRTLQEQNSEYCPSTWRRSRISGGATS
jgi:hypothetical protein